MFLNMRFENVEVVNKEFFQMIIWPLDMKFMQIDMSISQ
jgi:hypothetical protein